MIPPLRFFELYNAMSLHFKEGSSYDFFKYRGKTRCNESTLQKRNDKYTFQSLAKKMRSEEEAKDFLVANFIAGETYIRSFNNENMLKFRAYKEAYLYKFIEEFKDVPLADAVEASVNGDDKYLIFICLFDAVTDGAVFTKYDKVYSDNILWETLKEKLLKIKPFVLDRFFMNDNNGIIFLRTAIREARKQEV